MSVEFFEDLDRGFIELASDVSYGFRRVCIDASNTLLGRGVVDTENKVQELAKRIFATLAICLGICFAGTYIAVTGLVLSSASTVLRAIGFSLQKEGYTQVKGLVDPVTKADGAVSLMTLNARAKENSASYDLPHWEERCQEMKQAINDHPADILLVQEAFDDQFTQDLMPSLQENFASIVYLSGQNILGYTNGHLIATKLPMTKCLTYDYKTNDISMNRGAMLLEFTARPESKVADMRLLAAQIVNKEELDQVEALLKESSHSIPTFILGSVSDEIRPQFHAVFGQNALLTSYPNQELHNCIASVRGDGNLHTIEKGVSCDRFDTIEKSGADNAAVHANIRLPTKRATA